MQNSYFPALKIIYEIFKRAYKIVHFSYMVANMYSISEKTMGVKLRS